jgi:hypothetical protein
VILSAIGLFFAAVAAWGAVRTIQLTRRMQRDTARKRIVEALISVKYAARAIEEAPKHRSVRDLAERFRDAQQELERAWISAPFGAVPGDDEILEPLGSLISALPWQPDEADRMFELTSPKDAREMAQAAMSLLDSGELDMRLRLSLYDRFRWILVILRHPSALRSRARRGL